MGRKITFGILIAALLGAGVYWFIYTKKARMPVSEGIHAIPTDAAIIFESKQAKNSWKKLSQTNIMWEELLGTETIKKLNRQAESIDSALQLNPSVSTLLDDHSIFISLHPAPKNTFDLLYVYSLPDLTYQSSIEEYFENKINHGRAIYSGRKHEDEAMGWLLPHIKDTLHFSFANGILIISSKQKLVEAAIDQLRSGNSLASERNFGKVINTAGKNVDANVYVNYKNFPSLFQGLLSPSAAKETNALSAFADCSGWDISIRPNALVLSGFTQATDSGKTFLSLFNRQKPQEIELTKIIPSKTAILLFFGISNIKSFHDDYKKYLRQKKNLSVNNSNTSYPADIENSMLSWMDNEMGLVITEPSDSAVDGNAFGVIRSNSIDNAISTLNALADSTQEENKKPDTSSYHGHVIGHLNLPGILPQLFGWQFKKIKENYYTSIDNYIVFGNTPGAIKKFIEDYQNNKTLAKDKNYQSFSENMSAEANVYLYSSIARSTGIFNSFATEEFANELALNTSLFKKFEATGIQFSSNHKLFYSNVYLKYNPEQNQETGTLWETRLDTTISSKPYLLVNHNTKAREVLVQDDANKIYLISNTGKIIWTKQLNEKIMSDITQVDVLKNDKFQMIFNTRSFIYMYDRNGNPMKGFPIKLRSPATNSIAVIDYEKNREYRIFIATENKRIVCYKANGEQLTAFAFDKTTDPVYLPLQYFNAANKDHLCAIDRKGKIYILDRHGETRVKMREQFSLGIRNFFVEPGRDYNKSFIIASDTSGNIIKVSLTNNKESIKFQNFETSPYFDLRDINNDKTKEFILLTRNELKVFSQDRSLLFHYEFKELISQPPGFFLFPDNSGKIGIVSDLSNEVFLFNENGSLFNAFPLKGKTSFSIGDLNNEGSYNLVTGSAENSIFVYQFK
ncbi:MAG TPA: DUF3352 domain-containing protein [Bacteroidia bacterium]|jgi:hypothetical protein